MPELPEVEAARSAIAEHCIGKKIIKAIIANDSKVIDGISPSDFEASLLNKTIVAAHRKGKNMWLQLDSPPFPSFQFGMAGAVYIKGVAVTKYKRSAVNDTDEWPSKYSKFFVELNDGLEVSFTDTRRFAKVRLLDDPASVPPISELGPDTLLEPMTQEEFYKSLSKKKIAIKTLLLDQSFISGIGNWIADEVLYQARIHPLQHASSFSKDDSARLQKSIKEVIERAVEVGADSSQYPSSWIFHSREKKPGNGKAFVDGKKINFITVGGRTTAIVPELQKQTGEQATKAPAKPRKQASKKKSNDDDHDGNGEDNDDNDGDAADSDNDEEERGNLKSKRTKISKGGVKKPPRRNMTTKSDDDDETTKSRGSRAPAKRKSRGEGKKAPMENNDSDVGDEDGDERRAIRAKGQKPQVKMQTRKKAK